MRNAILAAIIGLGLFTGVTMAQDNTQITVTGTVEKIEYVYPTPWAYCKFMRIAIKTKPGKIVYAWIPPQWSIGIQIGVGDKVELQGFSFQYAGPGIVVSLIKNLSAKKTYTIGGPYGGPYGPRRGPGYWRGSRWW